MFPGQKIQPSDDEELLVPIPKSLYNQLTGSPIDISAYEPESSDYDKDGRLKSKHHLT